MRSVPDKKRWPYSLSEKASRQGWPYAIKTSKKEVNDNRPVKQQLIPVQGEKGEPGINGIGISSIKQNGLSLEISLTDGSLQVIEIPSPNSGKDGRGISSINQTAPDVALINFTDNEKQEIKLPSGKDGREIELRKKKRYLQWRYRGEDLWHTLGTISTGGGGGIAQRLSNLPDVNLSGLQDGQILVYSATQGVWIPQVPASNATWGSISGTLSNQIDLSNALNAKANASDVYTKAEIDAKLAGLVSFGDPT